MEPPRPPSRSSPPYQTLSTTHTDLLLTLAYNSTSTLLATGSVDQTIRIFSTSTTPPTLLTLWKAHDAAILALHFIPASFGTALVSTSLDRTMKLWEAPLKGGSVFDKEGGLPKWRLTYLYTPQTPAVYIPALTISSRPTLRLTLLLSTSALVVLDAPEPHDLSNWTLVNCPHVPPYLLGAPPSRETELSFALDCTTSSTRSPTSPASDLLFAAIGTRGLIFRLDTHPTFTLPPTNASEPGSLPSQLPPPPLETNGTGTWLPCGTFTSPSLVRDIKAAPSGGREWHLVATACKDGHVRIYRVVLPRARGRRGTLNTSLRGLGGLRERIAGGGGVGREEEFLGTGLEDEEDLSLSHFSTSAPTSSHPPPSLDHSTLDSSAPSLGTASSAEDAIRLENVADLEEHAGREVWRLAWNITGSVLVSAGDDGKVRIWKMAENGMWKCASVVGGEEEGGD